MNSFPTKRFCFSGMAICENPSWRISPPKPRLHFGCGPGCMVRRMATLFKRSTATLLDLASVVADFNTFFKNANY